jgi:hypothetical protein
MGMISFSSRQKNSISNIFIYKFFLKDWETMMKQINAFSVMLTDKIVHQ